MPLSTFFQKQLAYTYNSLQFPAEINTSGSFPFIQIMITGADY